MFAVNTPRKRCIKHAQIRRLYTGSEPAPNQRCRKMTPLGRLEQVGAAVNEIYLHLVTTSTNSAGAK